MPEVANPISGAKDKLTAPFITLSKKIITDRPAYWQIYRKVITDAVKGTSEDFYSPIYIGRIAQFRQSRVAPSFQEKGTIAKHPHVLFAHDIPVGVLKIADKVLRHYYEEDGETIAFTEEFIVTSVPVRVPFLEANIELVE